jgi:hypothetical protein
MEVNGYCGKLMVAILVYGCCRKSMVVMEAPGFYGK